MSRSPRKTLATNVRALMEHMEINQTALAERGNVGQKTISNLLNDMSNWPTLETITQVSAVFKIEPWQLLIEGMADNIDSRRSLAKVVANFLSSTRAGKDHIATVAEREFEYSVVARERRGSNQASSHGGVSEDAA